MDNLLGFIIIITILLLLVILIIKYNRTLKYQERINKYVIKNDEKDKLSLGDSLLDIYKSLKLLIVKLLKKSVYFQRKAVKYEKYSYIDKPLVIIATKFCLSIVWGLLYLISSFISGNFDFYVMLLFMVIGYYIHNIYLMIKEYKRNKLIEADLLKAIIIMNNAFKSGYNITQALYFVSKDLTGPISEEFERISNDLNYGLELKDVFDRFYSRVKLDDVKYITSSLSLLNLTGGNLVGIFSSIEKSFTNNKRVKDELKAMTSSSKLVFYILLGIPILLVLLLTYIDKSYFSPMVSHPLGILLMFISIILYIVYILIIRKILKVDL